MDDKAQPMHHLSSVGDSISAAAVTGVLAGWLPTICAVAALIWYGIQIYDWVQNKLALRRIRNG